jgi:hypothetical protein
MALNNGSQWPRNGFTLVARADNEKNIRRFAASAGGNQVIAIGQAVTIVNGVVVPATAAQDPAQAGFGIVMGVFNSSGRPFTQQSTKYIASGANGLVDVCYDPYAEYVVRCETSVGPSNINKNVVLTGYSARASLPQIIQSVDIPASASVGDLFRIIRLAEVNDLLSQGSNPVGGTGNAVIVSWNNHTRKAGTAGQ